MPTFRLPNSACIHTIQNFLGMNAPFSDTNDPAKLELISKWVHMDPMALAMAAAWGGWCQRNNLSIGLSNTVGTNTNYATRMKLLQHLGLQAHGPEVKEREEAGRFMPVTRVSNTNDLAQVIGDVSALLHLDEDQVGLTVVQFCVSELVRNVLEHSNSPEGGFVCATRYTGNAKRVSIAVADCGSGIAEHLGYKYPAARGDSLAALNLAMQFGITGATAGVYGAPNNAGAGLYMTRAIAKATGGSFVLISGDAAFRALPNRAKDKAVVYVNAFDDPRGKAFKLDSEWAGTVAAMEIVTEKIALYPNFFQWVRDQLPTKKTAKGKIKFT